MPTFHHEGDRVLWGRYSLSDAQVHRLANLFWDREAEARKAGDTALEQDACALNADLLDAFSRARGAARDLSPSTCALAFEAGEQQARS